MNTFEWSKAYFRSEDRNLHETKATMAALMTYADFNDLTCYPSQRTLARITGTHVDTIRRHLKKNIDAGWIRKVRDGSSSKQTNKYQLITPTPCTGAGSSGVGATPTTTRRDAGSSTGAGTTPCRDAGSTPCRDAPLTNQGTIQGTTQQSGSTAEPFLGSGDIPSGEHERVQRSSTNQETPCTGAGSSTRTDTGWLAPAGPRPEGSDDDTVIRWPKGKPFKSGEFDPFANYVDAETGEPIRL